MQSKSTAIGAFVLGALAIGVIAVLLFGGGHLFTTSVKAVVYFQNSVAGLEVGAPVTLRGVKVGTVRSMKVYLKLPELVPVIPVYIDIRPELISWTNGSLGAGAAGVALAVDAGLRAQLATQSLVTGQLSVNLDFHPEAPATLVGGPDGVPEIPSMPSDLQHIKDEIADLKLPELVEKARVTLTDISEIVTELKGNLGPLSGSLLQTSNAAHDTFATTTEAVRQLQADASRALDSVDRLSASTQSQVETTGKTLDQVLAAANRTVTKAEALVNSLNDIAGPRAQVRNDIEATTRDLAASASSLRNFSHELERRPNVLLLGKSAK